MDIYSYVVLIAISLALISFFYRSFKLKRNKSLSIYKWMRLGQENRNILDSKDKINVLQRKTRLINKTRREYLRLHKK